MKILKYLSLVALTGFLLVSCADEPLPFETFDEIQKGAFARKLADSGGNFFFTDPGNSAFDFTVEYYGENKGGDIASHDWYVFHRNNATGTSSTPVLMTSTPASSFGTNATSGLPEASFAFSLDQALSAMGLTIDDVNGGDDIIFNGILVMNDGRTFGPDNTGNSLQGNNGFDGIFRFVKSLLCNSELVGVYDVAAKATNQGAGIGWDGCDGLTWSGQVEFISVGDGEYETLTSPDGGTPSQTDLSMGVYYTCYGLDATTPTDAGGGLTIKDACNQLSWVGASRWGEVYSFTKVEVFGSNLVLGWVNDYGEGGEATITRTDGSSWPALK